MGFSSIGHWLIVLAVVLILFGAGKLPRVMGDLAKGIKNFKSGLKEEDEVETASAPKALDADAAARSAEVRKDEAART